jgi:hypothetical protein
MRHVLVLQPKRKCVSRLPTGPDWKFLKSRLVDARGCIRQYARARDSPTTQPAVKNPRALGRATIAAAMTLDEFSATVVRNKQPEFIELDLRPFGTLQGDALEFWLDLAIKARGPFWEKGSNKNRCVRHSFPSVPREVTRARRFIFRDRRADKAAPLPLTSKLLSSLNCDRSPALAVWCRTGLM